MTRTLKIGGKQTKPEKLKWFPVRKKPVEVKAVKIEEPFEVETLEGTMKGNPGDYLIEGVNGEMYPIKPNIFEKTYQPAKEWTKIVAIPCRDCGEVLSILTVESTKILDARCPKCHKAFIEKGEEFNLEIGYTRSGEAISPGALSAMADNGVFGLEKWLLGIRDEKAKKLLRDGIAFCDYLINIKESRVAEDAATNTKNRITALIGKEAPEHPLMEAEARAMQAFFNSESAPMLKSVLAQQLSREHGGKNP